MKTEDKIDIFYKTSTLKDILYCVFGLGIAYTKGTYTLKECKAMIGRIVEIKENNYDK